LSFPTVAVTSAGSFGIDRTRAVASERVGALVSVATRSGLTAGMSDGVEVGSALRILCSGVEKVGPTGRVMGPGCTAVVTRGRVPRPAATVVMTAPVRMARPSQETAAT
jgi:hypothetical protein